MLFTLFALLPAILAAPAPAKRWQQSSDPLPLDDGFPTPSADQLQQIFVEAHGTLSNSTPPAKLSQEGVTNLQLIDFGERLEAVFFDEFYNNVTNKVPGFEVPSWVNETYVVEFLDVVRHTEELHNLNAVNALAHFNQSVPQPCTSYNFPVSNFQEAVTLAVTLTSNVFGVLGDVANTFAVNGDVGLVRSVLQTATAEGEQNGFFRYLLGKTPQELPFTTSSNRDFAFTALQSFVDVSSCPDINVINLKTFAGLTVVDTPGPQTQTIKFELAAEKWQQKTQYNVVYVNQLNTPVVVPATYVSSDDQMVTVSATFPFDEHLMNGLTVVSVTDQQGPFGDVDAVAASAIWAPGFIIVN